MMAIRSSMHVPGFLTPVLTKLSVTKSLTIFLTCIKGGRRKIAVLRACSSHVSNLQPQVRCANHWLTQSGPVLMTIINPQNKEIACAGNKTSDPLVLFPREWLKVLAF